MGNDLDKVRTIFDLCEKDAIEELRKDNVGNSLDAARLLITYLAQYEACAAISFQSTCLQSPHLLKFNRFTNMADGYRWYTVTLIHGMVIDVLESDDFVPLPEFIYRLKGLNPMIDAKSVFVQGEGEVIGLKELHALCRGK